MGIKPDSVACTYLRADSEQSAAYIIALYRLRLQNDSFARVWSCTGADAKIVEAIAAAMQSHILRWNEANAKETGVNWVIDDTDGNGWLRLSPELEDAEFTVLEELWQLCNESSGNDDATFFEKAESVAKKSTLFFLLREMKVIRTDGSIKEVWPHIEHVVSNLHSENLRAMLPNHTATERQAMLRFTAFVHDLFNVVAIDNDWLQLHAHGSAALIYRFFVTRLGFTPEKSASIARVIDLHHILQLQKVDGLRGHDRALDPAVLATFYAASADRLEELGRLIAFSLADVSKREDFRSEHVIATLGILRSLLDQASSSDDANGLERKASFVHDALAEAAKVIAYLEAESKRDDLTPAKKDTIQASVEAVQTVLAWLKEWINEYARVCSNAMISTLAADPQPT